MGEIKKDILDLTFITNQKGETLKDRFSILIKDCKFFDCLVAYFNFSGFYKIYNSLKNTQKIRILIGIGTTKFTYELYEKSRENGLFTHYESKEIFEKELLEELENAEDKKEIEEGIYQFMEWLRNGKIEIRGYPSKNIHAKLYICTFREEDRDVGRVITGSSNFTSSGLQDNLEFNVELKNRSDYEFAKERFEELWKDSVDLGEKFIQTIKTKSYLKDDISPYELYLKLLYEYFRDELTRTDEIFLKYLPENFKRFEYQEQAVLNAKKILEEYGGVFISDVVGTGKTYISAMLVNQLDGRTLVIAPPNLLDEKSPGSWPNVFSDFKVHAKFFSTGKLQDALEETYQREYKNIIIDEAHKFRTETTIGYELLSEICRGKRVILVTATPYNNYPKDILNMISLFQNKRKSTIPNLPDIESFFNNQQKKLEIIDKRANPEKFIETAKKIAKEIREKVLKYLMVRRTRKEIEKYFSEDLEKNNIKFPEIKDPIPLFYQFNKKENEIFDKTLELITRKITYARYTPLLYFKKGITPFEAQSQRNMGIFMKVLLVKRLESSFFAFKNSIDRFYKSYEKFINEYSNGNVWVSKKYINKIFQLLEEGRLDEVQKLIDEGKAERYNSNDFEPDFIRDLENDFEILKEIKELWNDIERDPKLEKFISEIKENEILRKNKIVIFTESIETAKYLKDNLEKIIQEKVLLYTGQSDASIKDKVIENFDARAKYKKDDYRILVSTEVLSEGVNLHRANVVINYDIPWNPTRLIQRIGRVNRIDTPYDTIYTFNFFPTEESDNEIALINIARSKINAFLTLLGGDAPVLTEGEPVSSHELFDKLITKKTITEEDEAEESELKYLKLIEEIREKDPELFEKIKNLPKKARSSKSYNNKFENYASPESLITFFRKGKIMKFFIADRKNNEARELDFITTAKIFESLSEEKRKEIPLEDYYLLLDKNKTAFYNSTIEELIEIPHKRGKDSCVMLLKFLKTIQKNTKTLTEEQEEYLKRVMEQLESGSIPKVVAKKVLKKLEEANKKIYNPLLVLKTLQENISSRFLEKHIAERTENLSGKREIILSLYLSKD